MQVQKLVCSFCGSNDGVEDSAHLIACYRCQDKYVPFCICFLNRISEVLDEKVKGWSVTVAKRGATNSLCSNQNSTFSLVFTKGNVMCVTVVDKAAFFSVVSRMSTDFNLLHKKKATPIKKKSKKK